MPDCVCVCVCVSGYGQGKGCDLRGFGAVVFHEGVPVVGAFELLPNL